jgi:hypothetical protein
MVARRVSSDNAVYLGIDPGQSGGLVALCGDRVALTSMPVTERDVWDWLKTNSWMTETSKNFAVLELVHSFPHQGIASSFKFGQGFGALRMALTGLGVPFELASPQKWQQAMGISPRKKGKRKNKSGGDGWIEIGGESKTQFKNRLKAVAQRYFPSEKVTLATADALLLSLYCRKVHNLQR